MSSFSFTGIYLGSSLGSQEVKCLPEMWRSEFIPWVGKSPRSRKWQPIPVFLSGESPWTEEPGRLQSLGSQRVRHDWVTNTHIYCDKVEKAGFFSLLKSMSRSWNLLKFTSRIGTSWRVQINLIPLSMYSVTRLQLWLSAFGQSMVLCYLSLKRSIFTWQYNLLRAVYDEFNLNPTFMHLKSSLLKIWRSLKVKFITGKRP